MVSMAMACLSPINAIRKLKNQLKKRKQNRTFDVKETFPLLSLPSSVLVKLFSILPVKDLQKLSESCRYVHQLSQHNSVWKKLCKYSWGTKTDDAVMCPSTWKQYYMLRHVADKEGAFQWEDKSPKGLKVSKRYQHSGCVVGDKVYFIGGQELPDKRFNDIFVLNPNMEMAQVHIKGKMPKFARHTAVPIGDKIYLFGGYDGVSQHFHLSVFDTQTKSWTSCEGVKGPSTRTNHSATTIGNKMYLFGGMYKDSSNKLVFLNDLHMLDTETTTWTELPQYGDVPAPRCGHRLVVLNGMIVLFGGGSGEQWDKKYNDVHIYNPVTHVWTKPKLTGSAPVCTFTVAFAAGGFLFVYGGQSLIDNNLTSELYRLDLTSMEWTKQTASGTVPGARDASSGNVVGSNMYMLGGYCGSAIDTFHTLKMNKRLTSDGTSSFALRPVA